MNREQQNKIRTWSPILLASFVAISFSLKFGFAPTLAQSLEIKDGAFLGFVLLPLGLAYKTQQVREKLVLNFFWSNVNENIKSRIVKLLPSGRTNDYGIEWLKTGNRLLDLFYKFVDKDDTLKFRSERVRETGTFMSILADMVVFSLLGAFCHVLLAWYTLNKPSERNHLSWVALFALFYFIGRLLLQFTFTQHKDRSNGQLDYLANNYRSEINEMLSGFLCELPPPNSVKE